MPLNAIKHPLLAHKIALLRQDGISTKQFRELANEVASLLTYEATRIYHWKIVKLLVGKVSRLKLKCFLAKNFR